MVDNQPINYVNKVPKCYSAAKGHLKRMKRCNVTLTFPVNSKSYTFFLRNKK